MLGLNPASHRKKKNETVGGLVYSFGIDDRGQLGHVGNTVSIWIPEIINGSWAWGTVTAAAAGADHSAIVAGGQLYTFGDNTFNQLGFYDETDYYDTPHLVNGPWGTDPVSMVTAGGRHTVIVSEGTVYTFGKDSDGELGNGPDDDQNMLDLKRPQALTGELAPWCTDTVQSVCAGCYHTMVLAGGRVYACGSNVYGQLGLGSLVRALSMQLLSGASAPWCDTAVTSIAARELNSMVLADGSVYTFGSNSYSQLGLGIGGPASVSIPKLLKGQSATWAPADVTMIAVGSTHSLVVADGILYGFGWNLYGQLGLGTNLVISARPRAVVNPPWGAANITSMAAGYWHSILIAGGKVYVFGRNNAGQLGTGGTLGISVPMLLTERYAPWNPHNAYAVAAGNDFTIVLAGESDTAMRHGTHSLGPTDSTPAPAPDWDDNSTGPPAILWLLFLLLLLLLPPVHWMFWRYKQRQKKKMQDAESSDKCQESTAIPMPPLPSGDGIINCSSSSCDACGGVAQNIHVTLMEEVCTPAMEMSLIVQTDSHESAVHLIQSSQQSSMSAKDGSIFRVPAMTCQLPASKGAAALLVPAEVANTVDVGFATDTQASSCCESSFHPTGSRTHRQAEGGLPEGIALNLSLPLVAVDMHKKGLGRGATGQVYTGTHLTKGTTVAIKVMELHPSSISKLQQEVQLLYELRHPNIVQCFGYFLSPGCLNIVMEYVPRTLEQAIKELHQAGCMAEPVIKDYSTQILQGTEFIHSRNVVHRDLKPANVLVDTHGTCKIADFGASKEVSDLSTTLPSCAGTPQYMAPEAMFGGVAQFGSDVWSFACIVYEMLVGRAPWHRILENHEIQSPAQFFIQVAKARGTPLHPDDNITQEASEFLRPCFASIPEDRPTCSQLLQHTWISGAHLTHPPPPDQ